VPALRAFTLDQIAASIRAFGFTNPILVDPDGRIIAGHGRFLAARALSLKKVPTIELGDLSEIQKRALRIADNKIALGAGWDLDLLKIELSEIEVEMDLSITGFSTGELDVTLNGKADAAADLVPPVPSTPRTRNGDIWQAGDHRIGCGDARNLPFLQEVMGPDTRADAAFLDPPYNVKINGHANAKGRHREFELASGEMSDADFRAFLSDTLSTSISVSRDGAVHFVCMDWRHIDDVFGAGANLYGSLLNLCVWNKSNAGMGSLYRSKHELISVFRVGDAPHFNAVQLGRYGRNRTNIWDYASVNSMAGSRRQDLALHPTVKPTALVADAIQDVTKRQEIVLDVFLGSGTTLLAAERTGRRFRGIELDPRYVDVALERWSALTGKEPRLAQRDQRGS